MKHSKMTTRKLSVTSELEDMHPWMLLFSCCIMSNSLQPHELQHIRLPCPSLSPGVCANSCSLSWWCYLTISSSGALFSFYLQSLPASGSFPISQFFASGGQSIGVSADLPMNIQGWSPLGWTDLISLQSKGFSRVFSNTAVRKHQFFDVQPSLWSNSHIHTWLLEKPSLWLDRPLSVLFIIAPNWKCLNV